MAAEEYLRMAWHADRDGRPGMRDALLTLAVAESGPGDAVLAERCRRRLVAGRPEHWYASFPTLGEALAHPRVLRALDELRAVYPIARVRHLLVRADALRGPYRGGSSSAGQLVDELLGVERPRRRRERELAPLVPWPDDAGDAAALANFYLTLLLAMAALTSTVLQASARDRAA